MRKVGGEGPGVRPAHREFPPEPMAAASARGFLAEWLSSADLVSPEAIAVMGELASNAVRYGTSDFHVRVEKDHDVIRIEVSDKSPERPVIQPLSSESAGGRGLHLVAAYAQDWGIQELPQGKCVWAEIPILDLETLSRPVKA
jgi:anti-sigma regulatory factor (Ser/Thr protein kinase)